MSGPRTEGRSRSGIAWGLAAVAIAGFVAAIALNPWTDVGASLLYLGIIASLALVGALLTTRVPRNRIGPMLLLAGTLMSVQVALGTYAALGSAADPVWPATALVGTLTDSLFIFPIVIILVGVPLLFPDGHLPSHRFRWIAWLTIAALVAATVADLFHPGLAGTTGLQNPLGVPGLAPAVDALLAFGNLSAFLCFGGAAAAVWVRFHRGDAVVREQVKWLLAAIAVAAITFPAAFLFQALQVVLADGMFLLAFLSLLALPITIGIAILRYRLYDIDRIVSRTIAYAIISAVLLATYAAVILFLTGPLGVLLGHSTVAVAISTLVVAALFQPLRRRVQTAVDRHFDRARYDGHRMAEAFAGRLRDEVDIAAVSVDLNATVRAAVKPSTLLLWVRGPR
jgi:hypothetical protein